MSEECANCGGSGKVDLLEGCAAGCPLCNGTGYIEEKTIKIAKQIIKENKGVLDRLANSPKEDEFEKLEKELRKIPWEYGKAWSLYAKLKPLLKAQILRENPLAGLSIIQLKNLENLLNENYCEVEGEIKTIVKKQLSKESKGAKN